MRDLSLTTEAPDARADAPGARALALTPWPFRLLWASSVLNQAGFWIQQVGVGWLILELTDSPLQLGLASFMRGLPMMIVSPIGGVLVDRFDRRRMVLLSQLTAGLCALALVALIAGGWVAPWHVYLLSLISGATVTVNFPARQAMIPALVPPGEVGRAVASIAAGQNGARVVSPGLAGALISVSGLATCFFAQVLVFATALGMTWGLPTTPRPRQTGASALRAMTAGFAHIRESPSLRALMLLAIVPTVLALPYQQILPVFARDVYDIGAGGLGLLLTANSVGAFLGALAASWLLSLPRRGLILLLGGMWVGLGLIVLALMPSVPLAMAMLFLVGAGFSVYNSTNNTLIHEATTDAFRGRVMSIYLMTWSLMPMGTLPAGALADRVGAPLTVAMGGGLCALLVLLVWLATPALRKLC
ncbi:MAG TPA: MFS transporter [Chloroflexota bacterium]|nr:MFS transporter [Chloroflexota bacterium]